MPSSSPGPEGCASVAHTSKSGYFVICVSWGGSSKMAPGQGLTSGVSSYASVPTGLRVGGRAEPDGYVKVAEPAEHVLCVLGAGVRDDITEVVARPEQLSLDVGVVLGEHVVDGREHAGRVAVQVDEAVRARNRRQRDARQVDAQRRRPHGDVVVQLASDELADVLLGLLRRPADVR